MSCRSCTDVWACVTQIGPAILLHLEPGGCTSGCMYAYVRPMIRLGAVRLRCIGCVQADAPSAAAQLHGLQSHWRDSVRAVKNFASRPFEVVRAMQLPELMLQLDLNGFYQRAAQII